MPGRYTRHPGALVALVVLTLVGAGLFIGRSAVLGAVGSYLPSAPKAPCVKTRVTIVAAPQISGVVRRVVAPLDGRPLPAGSCLSTNLEAQAPALTTDTAAGTATEQLPQIWIPDSSLWAGQTGAWRSQNVGSVATSPVVVATSPAAVSRLGWQGRNLSWPEALDATSHPILAPGMTDDASSLLGLFALAQTLGPGIRTQQQVAATVVAASRVPGSNAADALDRARRAGTPTVLLTNEQVVADANRQKPNQLVAIHPSGVPAALDFPLLRVDRTNDDPLVHSATDVVIAALTAPAARKVAAAAGFGPPAQQTAAADPARARAAQAAAGSFVARIRALALPSRLLITVDTSLSMKAPVAPGLSRVRLAAQVALGAARLLPDESAIGVWNFAGRQPGGQTHQQLAGIDLLKAVDRPGPGSRHVTHRDVVDAALVSLPRRVSPGGTALYDTTLAALRDARRYYDRRANNAVVLVTDGANDFARGISLKTFVKRAKAEAASNPDEPVLLIAIGIGPQADMKALNAMCQAAGGRAYQANSVAALQHVLVDSVAHPPAVPHPAGR